MGAQSDDGGVQKEKCLVSVGARLVRQVATFVGAGRIWRGGMRQWKLGRLTLAPGATSTHTCTTCHRSWEVMQ